MSEENYVEGSVASEDSRSSTAAQSDARNSHSTLWGMFAEIYRGMDAEDRQWIDREWVKWRGEEFSALTAEREECAKVAEEISPLTAGKVIAAAIRARGQK